MVLAPQARDLLLVARSERPVVSLSLGLDRRDPLIRRLLRLGEPGSMGLPQVVLTPLGESLYPPQILFATFLGPAASRFELLAQRLYLPLLLPYDVLEFQLPLRSRAPQGLYGRRLTLVGSAPLLGQPPFEIFPVGSVEGILPFSGRAAGRLELGRVARLLLLVGRPELLLPMFGGVFRASISSLYRASSASRSRLNSSLIV